MKKLNELNSSEDSIDNEDLSFFSPDSNENAKLEDEKILKENYEKYIKSKKKKARDLMKRDIDSTETNSQKEKRSLWSVFYEKFMKKSLKHGNQPIIEDIEFRINNLINSNAFQGIFSKKFEAQIKNYSAKNQPIIDIKKYINHICLSDTVTNNSSQKLVKQSTPLINSRKKVFKKKSLMELIPDCDLHKLINNFNSDNPGNKSNNQNHNLNTSGISHVVDQTYSMTKTLNENKESKITLNDIPTQRKSNNVVNSTITPNDSMINNKKQMIQMSSYVGKSKEKKGENHEEKKIVDKKPEKFRFVLNKEERDVLKLISNNKYSYEVEFEGYEHLLNQNKQTKKHFHNLNFKFLENLIIVNSDRNMNEKFFESSSRLKNFQARTNNFISAYLSKKEN